MPGATRKRTQKARPKKQPQKDNAVKGPPKKPVGAWKGRPQNQPRKINEPPVHVYVNTQAATVISKTKPESNRAPRRKPEPAPAAPAPPPVLYASVFNTSPTPVTARQPVFDFPVQYEPVKSPAVDVQNIPAPSITARPSTVSVAT